MKRCGWSHSRCGDAIVTPKRPYRFWRKILRWMHLRPPSWPGEFTRHGSRPGTALCVLLAILLAAWLCAELMEQPGWGVFAAGVLLVGCNRFFFPTRYELDAEGISARFPLKTARYPWAELRRFVFDEAGGFLSPRTKRSFLDEYRGVSVLFGKNSEEVIRQICNLLPDGAIVRDVSREGRHALRNEGRGQRDGACDSPPLSLRSGTCQPDLANLSEIRTKVEVSQEERTPCSG